MCYAGRYCVVILYAYFASWTDAVQVFNANHNPTVNTAGRVVLYNNMITSSVMTFRQLLSEEVRNYISVVSSRVLTDTIR